MSAMVGENCRWLPASAVVVAGEADPVIPIGGGVGIEPGIGSFWSLERLGAFLRQQQGCARYEIPDAVADLAASVLPIRAADCRKGGTTELFRVVNGGHGGLLRAVPPELILRALAENKWLGPYFPCNGRSCCPKNGRFHDIESMSAIGSVT